MKLVILKQSWMEKPYVCAYDAGSGKPVAATEKRFATEEEARAWCKQRIDGVERIAEFDLPGGTNGP